MTNRLRDQMKYAYDAAHNLSVWTNNSLIQLFNVNSLIELSTVTHNTNNALTVNSTSAFLLYRDFTFGSSNSFTITNRNTTFTAIASDCLGFGDTNVSITPSAFLTEL